MKNGKVNIKKICVVAMLTAIALVVDRMLVIEITPAIKISFAFIPVALAAVVFGPFTAAAVYAVADVLGALIRPMGGSGVIHPGLTLSFAAMGLVYGFALCKVPVNISFKGEHGGFVFKFYRNKTRFFPNVIIAALINSIVFDLVVNTAWLNMILGGGYLGLFIPRLLKCAIMIPAQILIIPVLLKVSVPIRKILGASSKTESETDR